MAALLLIFFEDYQAYELLSMMMDQSSNMTAYRNASLRWHFVFKEEQMKNLAASFFTIVAGSSSTLSRISQSLSRHRIDRVEFFSAITGNFFYGYLPFHVPLVLSR